ncbi:MULTISPECIES: DUF3352 domain-containing protein [unclassified Microcoleus]|uniref:DUF3352 domain-containing protein n=1 Tax=unclassified Microcoleus TaxID=2642155 RepID=UPI001D431F0D|nr:MULTISPECIES: DUF3352 domain-containing protein [unclassified Microcoleus]MCC3501656.1 DUF3352 domain-containing protein [Microcoleus sp. PH2017_19_SFW_U_A]MCC3520446.1 DUF3352 domain-containing protein [Microcoleus sp. PH2017_20_SFW_D_A]MCC3551547.1 DUF3352 domain-containing protein [Microcoleus sp. PH2017_35_SFW_U_B]TAG99189.1 MAG: DUF3352 domain-containing protein [Oscillatoriales cyanobacterium]
MKLRSFFSFLIAGVLVLLALSAGGFYWLSTKTPLNLLAGGPTTTPAAAVFVSKQSPVLVSMLVNPDRLEALRQIFASPEERSRSHAEFEQIKKSFLVNTGLDYSRDIQPWIGDEITFATTTPDFDDRELNNGKQTGFLLAVSSQNADRSQEFLTSYWQKESRKEKTVQSEVYKGVKISYKESPITNPKKDSIWSFNSLSLPNSTLPPSFATAAIGGSSDSGSNSSFVLFANSPNVLRDAIDNVESANRNLNNSPNYQKALQQLTQGRIALGFVNLPQPATEKNPQVSPNSLAVAIGVNRRGLLAQTALVTSGDKTAIPTLSAPVQALQYIPSASPFTVASTDLRNFWTDLSSAVSTNTEASKLVDRAIADLQENWGVNLPQDIFNWVQGEYALAVVPSSSNTPDWIFAAEKSADAQKAIDKLDEIARSKEYSIGNFTLRNQKITAWTQLTTSQSYDVKNKSKSAIETEAKGVRATVGKYEIFTTSVEAMDAALKAAETGSLVANQDFQTSIEPLPPANDGYFYLDWPSSRAIWEKQIPLLRLIELSARPLFDHLRSLTVTSTGEITGIRKATIFMRLN